MSDSLQPPGLKIHSILEEGSVNMFCERPDIDCLVFEVPLATVGTIQLCCWDVKTVTDNALFRLCAP